MLTNTQLEIEPFSTAIILGIMPPSHPVRRLQAVLVTCNKRHHHLIIIITVVRKSIWPVKILLKQSLNGSMETLREG